MVAAELAAEETPARLAQAVTARWGALDVLFNNAGVQIDGSTRGITNGPESVLHDAMAQNLIAPYRLCRALLPMLRAGTLTTRRNATSSFGLIVRRRYASRSFTSARS